MKKLNEKGMNSGWSNEKIDSPNDRQYKESYC